MFAQRTKQPLQNMTNSLVKKRKLRCLATSQGFLFWLGKENSAGQNERKKKRGEQKKWEDNIKEWTGMDFVRSTRVAD